MGAKKRAGLLPTMLFGVCVFVAGGFFALDRWGVASVIAGLSTALLIGDANVRD